MAGNVNGGRKAAATNFKRYGKDFYKRIGAKGGMAKTDKPKGFAANKELARVAGAKGGRISRRGPVIKDPIKAAEKILKTEATEEKKWHLFKHKK